MPKVFFDSSFLMAVAQTPTAWLEDIVEGLGSFDPVLLDCVSGELEGMAEGEGSRGRMARVALEMAAGFIRAPCGGASADDELVSAAVSNGGVVATVDGELIRALEASHIKVISLSGGRVRLG